MPLLAHAGHWLVNLMYMGPVIVIVTWISINSIRDRRREKRGGHTDHKEPPR